MGFEVEVVDVHSVPVHPFFSLSTISSSATRALDLTRHLILLPDNHFVSSQVLWIRTLPISWQP